MKKLKLTIEELKVESFITTSRNSNSRGTVKGNMPDLCVAAIDKYSGAESCEIWTVQPPPDGDSDYCSGAGCTVGHEPSEDTCRPRLCME